MTSRERMIAVVVGVLIAVAAVYFSVARVKKSFSRRRGQLISVQQDIERKEQQIRDARDDVRRLAEYEEMSLPCDIEVAQSQYWAWLSEIVEGIGLIDPQVKVVTQSQQASGALQLTYSVNGEGDLDQIATLLYDFYAVETIHRIRRLPLTPIPETRLLQLNMTVEALVLPTASSFDFDFSRRSAFASESLASYAAPVLQRNLFAPPNAAPSVQSVLSQRAEIGRPFSFRVDASDPDKLDRLSFALVDGAPEGARIDSDRGEFRWTPPELGAHEFTVRVSDDGFPRLHADQIVRLDVVEQRAVETSRPGPPKFDDARFTYVIAMLEVSGQRQLWLQIRTKGEIVKVAEGDTFEVGSFKGQVTRIGARDAELAADGATRMLHVGDPLISAHIVGPGGS